VSFSRDFVDKEVGPFHTSLGFKIIEHQVVDKDSYVNLQAYPPKGGGEIMGMRNILGG
jgi:hypothetical protein